MDQRLALLLGLLAGLQRVVVNTLGLVTAFLLQTQGFTANRLQILQRLLSVGFVLLSVMALEFRCVGLDLLDFLLYFCAASYPAFRLRHVPSSQRRCGPQFRQRGFSCFRYFSVGIMVLLSSSPSFLSG